MVSCWSARASCIMQLRLCLGAFTFNNINKLYGMLNLKMSKLLRRFSKYIHLFLLLYYVWFARNLIHIPRAWRPPSRSVLKANATQRTRACIWPVGSLVIEAVLKDISFDVSIRFLTSTSRAPLSIQIISAFPRNRVNITRHTIPRNERSKC